MKVEIQTAITPKMTIYDTEDNTDSPFTKWLYDFLNPVINVSQGQIEIYKNKDFYDNSLTMMLAAGCVVLGGLFLLRMLKKF